MAARSLVQRLLPERRVGLTDYFINGLPARIEAACWQLDRQPQAGTLLEIGCGHDLHLALTAAIRYGRRVIAFDVRDLISLPIVNHTLRHLGSGVEIHQPSDLERIGITYLVGDRIDGCGDFAGVMSNASFEHIPEADLADLFAVVSRRIGSGGMMTAVIDLNDHWSYVAAVGPDHFYYLNGLEWALLNNRRMWQNRLRLCDYQALAISHGWTPADAVAGAVPVVVDRARINRHFSRYRDGDLVVGSVRIAWRR